MTTFKVPTDKFVTLDVEAERVEFIDPSQSLNGLPCSGGDHKHAIGKKRPIALVWASGRGWRLCHDCSKHLTDNSAEYDLATRLAVEN